MSGETSGVQLALTVGGETFRTERELLDVAPARIAELDARARRAAKEAVGCALAAGRLLLAVRDRLPHGAFLAWVAANCGGVTHRTATKYMQLAEAVAADGAEADGSPAAVGERPLSQLYRDYGIVRANGDWGGRRNEKAAENGKTVGRRPKDLAAEAEKIARDPGLAWAEAEEYANRLYAFAIDRDGLGDLETTRLRELIAMVSLVRRRAEDIIKAREKEARNDLAGESQGGCTGVAE